nr:hypothetical protein [Escherichia coli]
MGSCAAPSAKGDDKFITTDYLQQCPNRSLLSSQGDAIRNIIGALVDVRFNTYPSDSGVFTTSVIGDASSDSIKGGYAKRVTFDASRVVPTANENRPRNIAFNYIVRAA